MKISKMYKTILKFTLRNTLRKMKATQVAIDLHSLASAVLFTKLYILLLS